MEKLKSTLIFLLVFIAFLFLSCSSRTENVNENNNAEEDITGEDYIKILSVEPNSNLTETPTEFTIEVEYNLVSEKEGYIVIGFSTDTDPKLIVFEETDDTSKKVKRGSGTFTFMITTTPKDWKEEGDYVVGVILRDNLSPLVFDTMILTFGD